jgi:putative protease
MEVGKITNFFSNLSVAEIKVTSSSLKKGDEYVIIGETTGVIKGIADTFRVNEKDVEEVKRDDIFTMLVDRKVRRSDKLYFMKPVNA